MTNNHLVFTINTSLNTRFNTRPFISQLLKHDRDDITVAIETLKRNLYLSDS